MPRFAFGPGGCSPPSAFLPAVDPRARLRPVVAGDGIEVVGLDLGAVRVAGAADAAHADDDAERLVAAEALAAARQAAAVAPALHSARRTRLRDADALRQGVREHDGVRGVRALVRDLEFQVEERAALDSPRTARLH